MNCWINSNSGDYVTLASDGMYDLVFISRSNPYLKQESHRLTPAQFSLLQGFIPIKYKKLFCYRKRKVYAKTLKGGIKGESERIYNKFISQSDALSIHRDKILQSIGL